MTKTKNYGHETKGKKKEPRVGRVGKREKVRAMSSIIESGTQMSVSSETPNAVLCRFPSPSMDFELDTTDFHVFQKRSYAGNDIQKPLVRGLSPALKFDSQFRGSNIRPTKGGVEDSVTSQVSIGFLSSVAENSPKVMQVYPIHSPISVRHRVRSAADREGALGEQRSEVSTAKDRTLAKHQLAGDFGSKKNLKQVQKQLQLQNISVSGTQTNIVGASTKGALPSSVVAQLREKSPIAVFLPTFDEKTENVWQVFDIESCIPSKILKAFDISKYLQFVQSQDDSKAADLFHAELPQFATSMLDTLRADPSSTINISDSLRVLCYLSCIITLILVVGKKRIRFAMLWGSFPYMPEKTFDHMVETFLESTGDSEDRTARSYALSKELKVKLILQIIVIASSLSCNRELNVCRVNASVLSRDMKIDPKEIVNYARQAGFTAWKLERENLKLLAQRGLTDDELKELSQDKWLQLNTPLTFPRASMR